MQVLSGKGGSVAQERFLPLPLFPQKSWAFPLAKVQSHSQLLSQEWVKKCALSISENLTSTLLGQGENP